VVTASLAFGLVWTVNWAREGQSAGATSGRVAVIITLYGAISTLAYAYVKRQWLQYLRQQALIETRSLVAKAQGLDAATSAAVTLIQEVELVSRGYRMCVNIVTISMYRSLHLTRSSPLPPISRLEDRSQNRRCQRLRRTLHRCLVELITRYEQANAGLLPLAEQLDLEKYYDVYDINELDLQDAKLGYKETELDDNESLRALKIHVARLHTLRKVFLCCLLALEADGGKPDFVRWGIALDEIHAVVQVTAEAEERMRRILGEEEGKALISFEVLT
jgi:hypothetical protein